AHSRNANYFYVEKQIKYHTSNDDVLLGIFQAKNRYMRLAGVEEPGHDSGDPSKMAGAVGSAQMPIELLDLHPGQIGVWTPGIHLTIGRRKHRDIRIDGFEARHVFVEHAWIPR